MGQAVIGDPFGQGLRQPIVQALVEVRIDERIRRANRVKNRDASLRFSQKVRLEGLALEFGRQKVRQAGSHEVRAVGVVTVEFVEFAERIMQRSIKGAGGDQGAQLGNRLSELQA